MIDLEKLMKLRLFVLDSKLGWPVPSVSVCVYLPVPRTREVGDDNNNSSEEQEIGLIPLGRLITDHAGYVSFNVAKSAASLFGPGKPLTVPTLFVEVEGDPGSRIDVAQAFGAPQDKTDFTREAVLPTMPWPTPQCVPLVLRTSIREVPNSLGSEVNNHPCPGMPVGPSVEDADICDYELSPSSFMIPIKIRSGEGDCERPVPVTLPLDNYIFYQVVVRPEPQARDEGLIGEHRLLTERGGEHVLEEILMPIDAAANLTPSQGVRWGEVYEFEQMWHALGHSLGEIKYSLGLAPGESTQVAVIDWSRADDIRRAGTIESNETLRHRQGRDRQIQEVVAAALSEDQGGGSFQVGLGGAASGSMDALSGGATFGIGGAVTHSWGNRDLSADSIQNVNDRVKQASSVLRSQTSTVVIQAAQREANQLSVRAVANHNHCHALTIQYYEVLRHLLVRTTFKRRSWAILVPISPLNFMQAVALRFQEALAPALLRKELLPGFDAMQRLAIGNDAYTVPPTTDTSSISETSATHVVRSFEVKLFSDREVNGGNTWGRIIVRAYVSGYTDPVEIWEKLNVGQGGLELKNVGWPVRNLDGKNIDATKIEKVDVGWFEDNDADHWGFAGMRLECQVEGETAPHLLIDNIVPSGALYRFDDSYGKWKYAGPYAATPYRLPLDEEETRETRPPDHAPSAVPDKNADAVVEKRLLDHLNANWSYYSRSVWFGIDSGERRMRLESALGDLAYGIDERPIGWSGNHLAFRYSGPLPEWLEKIPAPSLAPIASLIALPTRGVFVEAQLGHCNACEKRDVTRMWNWAELPVEALPQLQGLTPGPRGQTPDVKPDTLGANVLNVLQAPQAPDPLGLAAALTAVSRGDAFRDMSGLQQVSDLLGKLASGAVDLTKGEQQIRWAAAEAKGKVDATIANGSARGDGGGRQLPTERYDNLQVAREAAQEGEALGWDAETTAAVTRTIVAGDSTKSDAGTLVDSMTVERNQDEDLAPLPLKFWKKRAPVTTLNCDAISAGMQVLDTRVTVHRFAGCTILLKAVPSTVNYDSWGKPQTAWIYLDHLGGAKGLTGFVCLQWMPCRLNPAKSEELKAELQEKRHESVLAQSGNLLETVCHRGLKVFWYDQRYAIGTDVDANSVVRLSFDLSGTGPGEEEAIPLQGKILGGMRFEAPMYLKIEVDLQIKASAGGKRITGEQYMALSCIPRPGTTYLLRLGSDRDGKLTGAVGGFTAPKAPPLDYLPKGTLP